MAALVLDCCVVMQHSIASTIVDFLSLYVLTAIAGGIGHPPDNSSTLVRPADDPKDGPGAAFTRHREQNGSSQLSTAMPS